MTTPRSDIRVLALDCAQTTGYALVTSRGVELSGAEDLNPNRSRKAKKPRGRVFIDFRVWLTGLIDLLEPTHIAYEEPHHRGRGATLMGVGLMTRVEELACQYGLTVIGVHTGTLKLRTTGDGKAEKDAMMVAASRRAGRKITSSDEGDAVCLGDLVVADLLCES